MTDTKEFIIDQAYKLFLSYSYEAVTISDISKSVGMTKGALYHHFLNKEELFRAVIDKFLIFDMWDKNVKCDSFLQFIDETISTSKRIISNTLGNESTFIPVNIMSLMIDALRHYTGFETGKELFISSQIDVIKSVLKDSVERGEIRNDLDIEITAINFYSINLGLASNLFTNKSPAIAFEILRKQLYEFYKLLKKQA